MIEIIFLGICFWLVYFSTTFENSFFKLFLKLFSVFLVIVSSYLPLVEIGLAEKKSIYDIFAWGVTNGMIFFLMLWFVVLLYESYMFFLDKKKSKLEGTQ